MTAAPNLEAARRAALRFLYLSAGSFACYRTIVHGMHRDRQRTGKIQRWQAKEVQPSMDRCAEAAQNLEACYGEIWALLVEANRPEHGKPLAFQRVRDMASAVMENWGLLSDKTPADKLLDTLIDTGRYILCSDEEALALWNAINHEFAIAGIKHGITMKPLPHPEAEARARIAAMVSPLLRTPKQSWEDSEDPRAARHTPESTPQAAPVVGGKVNKVDVVRRQADARADVPTRPPAEQDPAEAVAKPAAPPAGPERANPQVEFTAVERAVVLLRRDGEHPRSVRAYAKEVGVSHTTLGRNETWRAAWKFSQSLNGKSRAEMPQGGTTPDGELDAWLPEVCENCRLEEIVETVTVQDVVMRVCEACAIKLKKSRTSTRTTRAPETQ